MQALYGDVAFAGPQRCVCCFAIPRLARGSHLCVGLEDACVFYGLRVQCCRPAYCTQASAVRLVTGAEETDGRNGVVNVKESDGLDLQGQFHETNPPTATTRFPCYSHDLKQSSCLIRSHLCF